MNKEDKVNHISFIKLAFVCFVNIAIFANLSAKIMDESFFIIVENEVLFTILCLMLIFFSFGVVLSSAMLILTAYCYALSAFCFNKVKIINRLVNRLTQSNALIPALITVLVVSVLFATGHYA